MPHVTANGIQIAYETHGSETNPTVLMIMGLGGQLTMWSDELLADLVAGGYRVITFDNRDIGLSHHHSGEKSPAILRQILLRRIGIRLKTPYQLSDMAKDTIGLLDALNLDRVHLVGISMGGMIAQHVASMVPDRVHSLTAIMTTTGNPKLPRPSGKVMQAMIRRGPPPTTRDASAIAASGDFRKHTRAIKAPTLVLHGSEDPLVPIEGGKDIAKLVRGARFEVLEGMGHDVPPRFLPAITKHMLDHFDATKVNH